MRFLSECLVLPVMLLLFSACSIEDSWTGGSGMGAIEVSVDADGELERGRYYTRAEVTTKRIPVPESEEFSVRLVSADGSYLKTWSSLSMFSEESSFKVGSYDMEVFFGDESSEGVNNPYFYGRTNVVVHEGETTDVRLNASLCNCAVEAVYTEKFMKYFADWSATFHSEGNGYNAVPRNADISDIMYIVPGKVDVSLSVTDRQGRSVSIQPVDFVAEAGKFYRLVFDVNGGEVGESAIQIGFDETLTEVEVTVPLTDELFNAPAPEVKSYVGDMEGSSVDVLAGTPSDKRLKFEVVAHGGVKEAKLTVESSGYTFSFGNEIDLCSADLNVQQELEKCGIKAVGFYRNPDKYAFVDITDFCKSLKEGEHTVTLSVTDVLTRESKQPASIKITAFPVIMNFEPKEAVFASNEVTVTVGYNGEDYEKAFSFTAPDRTGVQQKCDITSIASSATRAFETKYYDFTMAVPDSERGRIPLTVYFYGKKLNDEVVVPVKLPKYTLTENMWARKGVLKVNAEPEYIAAIVRSIHLYIDGVEVNADRVVKDEENGCVTVSGLEPGKTYRLRSTLYQTPTQDSEFSTTQDVVTETPLQVPNGDFENLKETINTTINQGGKYTNTIVFSPERQNIQMIVISEPVGWGSVNSKTCNLEYNPLNSWFVTPSTFNSNLSWISKVDVNGKTNTPDYYKGFKAQKGSVAMVVRNVAWDNNGSLPGIDKDTKGPSGYHSTKEASPKYKAAGKLFLGSYSISGTTETYNEGVQFSSRPAVLKGYYTYALDPQDPTEKAFISVSLLNGNTVIGSGSIELGGVSEFAEFNIPIKYSNLELKATHLRIMISSSNHLGDITSETRDIKTKNICELFEQESRGATLVVDNLTFEY